MSKDDLLDVEAGDESLQGEQNMMVLEAEVW
jgi:hypothetical protein